MRQIKFRAWDDEAGIMLPTQDLSMPYDYWTWLGDRDVPLMQFTGLLDKNGVEIFEGDIIKQSFRVRDDEMGSCISGHHIGEATIIASMGVVLRKPIRHFTDDDFDDDGFKPPRYKQIAQYRSEIIGNIYENPELLGKSGEKNATI